MVNYTEKVNQSIQTVQKSKKMQKMLSISKKNSESVIVYKGHEIDVKNAALVEQKFPIIVQNMNFCHLKGRIYSGGSNVFTKEFAECAACFLVCSMFFCVFTVGASSARFYKEPDARCIKMVSFSHKSGRML